MVYIPQNNKIERSIIQKALVEKYIKRSSRTQMIIMGDLNCIVDADLDRLQKSKQKSKKQDPLIRWLSRQEFQDAYRVINPNERKFSWSGRKQETRIDYIWVAEDLASSLLDAEIQEMDIWTNSDHGAMVARINLDHLIATYGKAKVKKENHQRTVLLYDKATKEDWDNYRNELEAQLKKKISLLELQQTSERGILDEKDKRLDRWWDIISNAIWLAARKTLPKKRVLNTVENKKKRARESKLGKTLTQLGRWISLERKNIEIGFLKENIRELNDEIEYIN